MSVLSTGAQLLRVLGKEVSEPPHQARPFGAGHRAPGPCVDSRTGGFDRPVNVLIARFGGHGPRPTRVRVNALERCPGEGVHPLAPDQHLVVAHDAGRGGVDQPVLHSLLSAATTHATLSMRDVPLCGNQAPYGCILGRTFTTRP